MENQTSSFAAIDNLFVAESEIPEQFRQPEIHQREYLLNGKLVQWDGPVTEILSPVYVKGDNGLERKLLGTIPHTTSKEALESLDAAVAAYDNGQGAWPTMSVDDRIRCMQKFVYLMIQQRDKVIKLDVGNWKNQC